MHCHSSHSNILHMHVFPIPRPLINCTIKSHATLASFIHVKLNSVAMAHAIICAIAKIWFETGGSGLRMRMYVLDYGAGGAVSTRCAKKYLK